LGEPRRKAKINFEADAVLLWKIRVVWLLSLQKPGSGAIIAPPRHWAFGTQTEHCFVV